MNNPIDMAADRMLFNLEHMKAPWQRIEVMIQIYASQSDCYYNKPSRKVP